MDLAAVDSFGTRCAWGGHRFVERRLEQVWRVKICVFGGFMRVQNWVLNGGM